MQLIELNCEENNLKKDTNLLNIWLLGFKLSDFKFHYIANSITNL